MAVSNAVKRLLRGCLGQNFRFRTFGNLTVNYHRLNGMNLKLTQVECSPLLLNASGSDVVAQRLLPESLVPLSLD
jgi:hypothetical protein